MQRKRRSDLSALPTPLPPLKRRPSHLASDLCIGQPLPRNKKIAALLRRLRLLGANCFSLSERRAVVRMLNREVGFDREEIGDGVALLIGELTAETI
jgi:hypothetical protein